MLFTETKLKGTFVIEPEKLEDERGFFARIWDHQEFKEAGLNPKIAQCSISKNKKKGIIRGLHYQLPPYQETKLVRCTRGKLYDVIIDLRPDSKTFKQWFGIELSEENYKMIYVPEDFAHGYQTLVDNTDIAYQMSIEYLPKFYTGVRWDDPAFNIKWPLTPSIISKQDKKWELFTH